MITLSTNLWILQNQKTLAIMPESLATRRFACYVAGASWFDDSVQDLKRAGWKAIKVQLDYA